MRLGGEQKCYIALYITLLSISNVRADLLTSVAVGAIKSGASLFGTTASSLSGNGPNRNVVIDITNHLDVALIGGNYFLQWGWNRIPPPSVISPRTREVIQFEKVHDTATGTGGILSYAISNHSDPASFVIDFSVPFNYVHSSNWYGLVFVGEGTQMDYDLYYKFYYDDAWTSPKSYARFGYAYEGKPIAIFHNDYIVSATMSNFGRSILKVDVQKRNGGHAKNYKLFTG